MLSRDFASFNFFLHSLEKLDRDDSGQEPFQQQRSLLLSFLAFRSDDFITLQSPEFPIAIFAQRQITDVLFILKDFLNNLGMPLFPCRTRNSL